MLHLFFKYLALFISKEIVRAEKVLPGCDISEVHTLSLGSPFSLSLYDKAYWVYEHMPTAWYMWTLNRIAPKGYLDDFRNACCEAYETSLQHEAYHEQWASYYC